MASTPRFSLATYFARRTSEIAGPYTAALPDRPDGTVIWVWATDAAQIGALNDLADRLTAEGDPISFVVTLPDNILADGTYAAPVNRAQAKTFMTHWRPDLMIWMRDGLEPSVLVEVSDRGVPLMMLDAADSVLQPEHGGWVPGMARALLQLFETILTIDPDVTQAVIRAGAEPARVMTVGPMETVPQTLSHFEDERQQFAQLLAARPVWLAADTHVGEADILANAHQQAALRAHRLLLIVVPRIEEEGEEIARRLREFGFLVALRSADEEPDESTQVYVADFEGEMGLWYRIAPITYLGGSLTNGQIRNPFEAAVLGSAVVHGPKVSPYGAEIAKLQAARGCVSVPTAEALGGEIENLGAPDKAAQIVHGGWDVTSRGAEVTGRIADLIMAQLDAIGA